MEAIQRRGYWPREATKVTPEVTKPGSENCLERDAEIALKFLNCRPLNFSEHSGRFVKKGVVLSFLDGNKNF